MVEYYRKHRYQQNETSDISAIDYREDTVEPSFSIVAVGETDAVIRMVAHYETRTESDAAKGLPSMMRALLRAGMDVR